MKKALGFVLIVCLIMTVMIAVAVALKPDSSSLSIFGPIGGGGSTRDNGIPLEDPRWDMYFECTARQKAGGYGVVESGQRCEALRPE